MNAAARLLDPATINLSKYYPTVIACRFIPSQCNEGPITAVTLRNWMRAKRCEFMYRIRSDGRKAYFVKGAVILQLIGIEPTVAPKKTTANPRASSRAALQGDGFKNA